MYTSCVLGVAFFISLIYIALLPIKNIYIHTYIHTYIYYIYLHVQSRKDYYLGG